ncbi:sigma 54-interacting transcriptional regulator [Cytobacillus firmus]|uniref:Sigma54 specific transcriptional regulator, Fis family n=3 Tax=Cytobacillus firmus TaxID=1399 RepID=A0A800N8C9_CYTFI|nr:sigma 54-interacting transcriptional regulator [Cytobacillus firmus]KAF0821410.1 sigma54 specific transcriptional regulator, Fis family [Cytobacillus firmus]
MKNTGLFINNQLLDLIFESTYYGIVIVDAEGIIQYMSNNYCDFLGVQRDEVIGRHATEVIENTKMHLVAQTGKQDFADLQFLQGDFVIANRIPIIENNQIIGAVGTIIFRDLDEWKKLNSHIKGVLSELNYYRSEWNESNGLRYSLHDLIGETQEIKDLKDRVMRIATGDISILLRGESGTGKEILAQSIHQLSERSEKPFVKVNCGSIPEHLLESELFGYEDGAFTGARKGGKIGKFHLADGGTIFLDEVGDMPLHMQVKLLRVLQEKEFEPIGGLQPKKVNVRVIAATNRPLEKMINDHLFREDLFYRINAVQLFIPPLRLRRSDLPLLTEHFLRKATKRIGKRVTGTSFEAEALIKQYDWPGNIRELENVLEASVHLTDSETIGLEELPDYLKGGEKKSEIKNLKLLLEETEKNAIETALKKFSYDKNKAAESLGIGNSTIYDKIKKYNITS